MELYQNLQAYRSTNIYFNSPDSLAILELLTYPGLEDPTCKKSTRPFTTYTRPERSDFGLVQSGTTLFDFMQLSVNAMLRNTYTENVLQQCVFDYLDNAIYLSLPLH